MANGGPITLEEGQHFAAVAAPVGAMTYREGEDLFAFLLQRSKIELA